MGSAVEGVDAIIHNAFVIHPASERDPAAAEDIVRASGLPATVLRLSSILLDRKTTPENLRLIFDIPIDTRFDMVHPCDAATAFVNALDTPAVRGGTLFVGGGPSCQRTYRRVYEELFGAVGIGTFPEEAYSEEPFIGDWLALWATQMLRPLILRWMLRYSRRWMARPNR